MPYSRIKIDFDVTCLMVTALLTFFGLGRIEGLGIGTVAAAFTMGKGIVLMGNLMAFGVVAFWENCWIKSLRLSPFYHRKDRKMQG